MVKVSPSCGYDVSIKNMSSLCSCCIIQLLAIAGTKSEYVMMQCPMSNFTLKTFVLQGPHAYWSASLRLFKSHFQGCFQDWSISTPLKSFGKVHSNFLMTSGVKIQRLECVIGRVMSLEHSCLFRLHIETALYTHR